MPFMGFLRHHHNGIIRLSALSLLKEIMPEHSVKGVKNLLAIGYVWPEPNSSAAGKHMLSLLKHFAEIGYKVTFASPAQLGDHKIDLIQFGFEEVNIKLNCSSFDDFVAQLDPQIVLFDRYMMEEQFGWRVAKFCPNALRILDTEDLHFLREASHKAHKQGVSIDEALLKSELALREIAAIYRCDLTLIISDYEMKLLQDTFRVDPSLLVHCPFMLDMSDKGDNQPTYQQRQHFVSIGNFRHAPNWDAVLYLKQTIWPLIRKHIPNAELHVYGAYPPPKATALHAPKTGFYVDGWVYDAHQMLCKARVCLAPLRFGAGIKGKLADAMLAGTPSVTTELGAHGMLGQASWPGAIEDNPETFATQAVALYQQSTIWHNATSNIKPLLQHKFDKHLIAQRLTQTVNATLETLTEQRLKNFTGMMLQHHMHKSTQYMSQWIEEKNAHKS